MKILSFCNTSVKLEGGEEIGVDKKRDVLVIKYDNKIYISCEKASQLNLNETFHINSGGDYSQEKTQDITWKKYKLSE